MAILSEYCHFVNGQPEGCLFKMIQPTNHLLPG